MYLPAASLALILVGMQPAAQSKDMDDAWKIVGPSVIRLKEGFNTVGSAILLDSSGYFLAHKSIARVGLLTGVASNGQTFPLMRVSTDQATGLVLLQATMWREAGVRPIRSTISAPKVGTPVIIVMSNGLESGEISNPNRSGVLPQSNRVIFLTEIKLENPTPNLGGAPVFTYQGEFVGLLNANLQASQAKQAAPTVRAQSFEGSNLASDWAAQKAAAPAQNYGPSSLLVAYAIGPEMLQRVVSGFLSPTHSVAHPFIGIYVRDTPKGAEVQAINPSSPAASSDIKPGDLILSVGSTTISNRLDYARSLMHVRVGDRVKVIYLRKGVETTTHVTVGRIGN